MKYLGIDYGLERTGAAISDPEGKIAFPLDVFRLSQYHTRKNLLDNIAARARAEGVEAVVMGLPLYPDGRENEMCRIVRNFGERLRRRLNLPLYYISETYSSELAEMDLRDCGLKKKTMKGKLDQQAACTILQGFLDVEAGGESP